VNTHDVLSGLVSRVTCKPGWRFTLEREDGEGNPVLGLRLVIYVPGLNSRMPEQRLIVGHYFPVPEATYNAKSWRRWIFECCRKVEDHELGEWFLVGGDRPFAPLHGPGCDPYMVREVSTDEEARTDQRGHVAPPSIQPDAAAKEGP
jgi:hypothetical protein